MASTFLAAPVGVYSAGTDASGTWQGEYTCGQGSTGLTLTIRPASSVDKSVGDQVRSVFFFYPIKSNPRVPQGCFDMNGTVDPRTREVDLVAGDWLLQPPGYVTVDLAGMISSDGKTMAGSVEGPLCTRFRLRRVAAAPVAQACRGDVNVAAAP